MSEPTQAELNAIRREFTDADPCGEGLAWHVYNVDTAARIIWQHRQRIAELERLLERWEDINGDVMTELKRR